MTNKGTYCNYKLTSLSSKPFKARLLVGELIKYRDRSHFNWSCKKVGYGSRIFTLWNIRDKKPVHKIKVSRKAIIRGHDFYDLNSSQFRACKHRPCPIILALAEHWFYAIMKKKIPKDDRDTKWVVDEKCKKIYRIKYFHDKPYLQYKDLYNPQKAVSWHELSYDESDLIIYKVIYKKLSKLPTVWEWQSGNGV